MLPAYITLLLSFMRLTQPTVKLPVVPSGPTVSPTCQGWNEEVLPFALSGPTLSLSLCLSLSMRVCVSSSTAPPVSPIPLAKSPAAA